MLLIGATLVLCMLELRCAFVFCPAWAWGRPGGRRLDAVQHSEEKTVVWYLGLGFDGLVLSRGVWIDCE